MRSPLKSALLAIAMLASLAACGRAAGDRAAADRDPPAPEPKKETVFDPLLQARDKVQHQADTLPQERKDNLDRAIEADTQ